MMKLTYEQRQLINVYKNRGLKEGIDFRIVWFGEKAEVKLVKNSTPVSEKMPDIELVELALLCSDKA